MGQPICLRVGFGEPLNFPAARFLHAYKSKLLFGLLVLQCRTAYTHDTPQNKHQARPHRRPIPNSYLQQHNSSSSSCTNTSPRLSFTITSTLCPDPQSHSPATQPPFQSPHLPPAACPPLLQHSQSSHLAFCFTSHILLVLSSSLPDPSPRRSFTTTLTPCLDTPSHSPSTQ